MPESDLYLHRYESASFFCALCNAYFRDERILNVMTGGYVPAECEHMHPKYYVTSRRLGSSRPVTGPYCEPCVQNRESEIMETATLTMLRETV